MEQALVILVWLVVFFVAAYAAHWIIIRFFPADLHMPALLIVGVILLLVLLVLIVGWPPRLGHRGS